MSAYLEEIRELEGRDKGNGTLGNVQGNIWGGFREKGLGRARGEGILGQKPDLSTPLPFHPNPYILSKR